MRFEIEGKKYTVKERWREVSIREMANAFEVLSLQPPAIKKLITSPESDKVDVSEELLIKFYIDWVACFSDIPKEILSSKIIIDQPGTVSLTYLANLCLKFLGEPQKIGQINSFKFNSVRYKLIPSFTTLSGVNRLLNGATFGDWVNLNALMTAFDGLNKGKYIALANVSAVLFSDDFNDTRKETIQKRAETFMDLDCETAYAGYFFFEKHINKLQRFLKTSSAEEVQKIMGLEGLTAKYQGNFIGRLKLFFLRNLGFLTRWDKHR